MSSKNKVYKSLRDSFYCMTFESDSTNFVVKILIIESNKMIDTTVNQIPADTTVNQIPHDMPFPMRIHPCFIATGVAIVCAVGIGVGIYYACFAGDTHARSCGGDD